MHTLRLDVATEFTTTPGPRSESEGAFSGEVFLKQILEPRFVDAQRQGVKLLVNLDGTEGYATSFLEAAFGGLARSHGVAAVQQVLEFKSDDEPYLVEEIREYVKAAS